MESGGVFWSAGVVAIGASALFARFGLLGWVPLLGDLLGRGGPAAVVAAAVSGTTAWVLLVLGSLALGVAREQRATRVVMTSATRHGRAFGLIESEHTVALFDRPELQGTRVHHRYTTIRDRGRAGDREFAGFLVAARSSVEEARAEVSYGPVRALVWALPALGFLGTAAVLSRSVGGLGAGVASADVRDFVARTVTPPLADAFQVTLFALGCSVVCHLLVTVVKARADRLSADLDDWALTDLASRMPPPRGARVDTRDEEADAPDVAELLLRVCRGLDRLGAVLQARPGTRPDAR